MAIERWVRITVGIVLAATAVFLLYRLRFALITITLAAMLAYALLPLVDWIGRLRLAGRPVPRVGAVAFAYVLVIAVIAGVFVIATGPVSAEFQRFVQNMGQYEVQFGTLVANARASLDRDVPPSVRKQLDDALNGAGMLFVNALGRVAQAAGRWLSHVVEVILIPILAFYFLVDLPTLKQELLEFLPSRVRASTLEAARLADRIVAGYVRGQLILMAISGIVVWIGLAVIGLRFPLLLGMVAGLTRAIPVVGPVFGAIPIVGLALLQSPGTAVTVLVFFVVLQLVESKFILPQVIGHELNLHAATILLALLVGDALFGLMGMFLAAPAAAFLKEMRTLAEERVVAPGDTPAG